MISDNARNTVTVIGGGLAGLINAILLTRAGFEVTLIEKKKYPFHRVCGEYISNEVLPFLKSIGINIDELNPSRIDFLAISSISGRIFNGKLDLGGFGLSRFTLDNFLYQKALASGVNFILEKKVNLIEFEEDVFSCTLNDNTVLRSAFVIAAYGKRSNLDKNRTFFYQRSPYIGVKYHIKTDFPSDLVQLDNFKNGYCGTVKIEDDKYCLCYLSRKENLKQFGSIPEMENEILFKNPFIKGIFHNADFLYDKPEVINEISFEQKTLVENHILFCGDAAGMISPLCGNGMAMAIHSAKLLSDIIIKNHQKERSNIEKLYINQWNHVFKQRLQAGRLTQKLFGSAITSELAVKGLQTIKPLSNFIMRKTHGVPF